MKRNFKNINEELDRIKTLMFETDNFIENGTPLNETVEEATEVPMDEQTTETKPEEADFQQLGGSIKIDKVSDVNQFYRMFTKGYAYEKSQPVYKAKSTGDITFLDPSGQLTSAAKKAIEASLVKNKIPYDRSKQEISVIKQKDKISKDKIFFQILDTAKKSEHITDLEQDVKGGKAGATASDATKAALSGEPKTDTEKTTGQKVGFQTLDKTKTKEYIGKDFGEVTRTFDPAKIKEITQSVFDKKIFSNLTPGTEFYAYYGDDAKYPESVFKVSTDNKITAIYPIGGSAGMKESFNMDLLYTNPLIFESLINEQETALGKNYGCIGDCDDFNEEQSSKGLNDLFSGAPAKTADSGEEKKSETEKTEAGAETKEIRTTSDTDPWEYQVQNGIWFTRKKGTEKWISLNNPKFQKALDVLNKKFPDDGGNKTATGGGEKTPTGSTPVQTGEDKKTTKGGGSTWTRSFSSGYNIKLTSSGGVLDPTFENLDNLLLLSDSIVDCFDMGADSADLKDFGNYLKNMGGVKINLPSFKEIDMAGRNVQLQGIYPDFVESSDEFISNGKNIVSVVSLMNEMYKKDEGNNIWDDFKTVCNISAPSPSDDEEMKDYRKYVQAFYPNLVGCSWAKNAGSEKAV